MRPNVCQYWRTDERGVCPHWDPTIPICTYEDSAGDKAEYYPWCNMLGTQYRCAQYGGKGTEAMCVLPDNNRNSGNRLTGERDWVIKPTIDETGEITEAGNFSRITQYNEGKCDGHGTATKCTGYSPYHMQFGTLQPDDKDGSLGIDLEGNFTGITDYRLPLGYDIYNKRAVLSRCYWWAEDAQEFTVNSGTGRLLPVTFYCTLGGEDPIVYEYNDFKWDPETLMYRAPCNGAKPECPHYTGICWQYCIDSKMRHGDKVLAEQILEMRYYIRKNRWDPDEYEESFIEPQIQAWKGTLKQEQLSSGDYRYEIPIIRTFIDDFDVFTIDHSPDILTEGARAEDYRSRFPDKVRELKELPLTPLIRNRFETLNGENVLEVSSLQHENVLIFGDTFWYDSETYAINLFDPDLSFIPIELQDEDSMTKIEYSYTDPNDFEAFHTKLDCLIQFMIEYMPDKIIKSSMGKQENMFYIDMPTMWGLNNICVLNKGSGRWEFDKITFNKIFCSGVIGQTEFSILGHGEINYLPAYDRDFTAYANENGDISFGFFPMISMYRGDSAILNYFYNDSVRERLDASPTHPAPFRTYNLSYKLFRITAFSDLEMDLSNVRFFGNAGYALMTIPDPKYNLSNAIKPWEAKRITINYTDGSTCGMEIYDRVNNLDKLETNQAIIRPKDIKDFKRVCKDDVISIEYVYVYEKRSFGQTPTMTDEYDTPLPYTVVDDSFIGEDDVVNYHDYNDAELNQFGNEYTLSKFGYESLTIGAVFKGVTGHVKGQAKTKLIVWVRQPYCRDVEIMYSWSSIYEKVTLLPEYNCYGPIDERVEGTTIRSYTPPCGDHDLSFFTGKGPMWYPYTDCDPYARYNIDGVTEFDINIMEVFWEGYEPVHGQHDIRMLGPADQFGETCGSHAHLWNCLCDWSHCNYNKKGLSAGDTHNYFSGYVRYRGGLSAQDRVKALRNGGSLPKFGNVYRDFLRSYRSMDNVDYYYWNGYNYIRLQRWVPMYEYFTVSDLTMPTTDYVFKLYCSNDYYDDNSTFIHPMGMMLVENQIENVAIHEKIDIDNNGDPYRYRFEEIFDPHDTNETLYYPEQKNPEQRFVGGLLMDVIAWYTYKNYPGSNASPVTHSIQWAWQEVWQDLERHQIASEEVENHLSCTAINSKGCHIETNEDDEGDHLSGAPYLFSEDISYLEGRHMFLDVAHPDYRHSFDMEEHRLVCDEGTYELVVYPPEVDDEGEYEFPYWSVSLGPGPKRCFDVNGNWEPTPTPDSGDCLDYKSLYETCTTSPWATDVTLFAPGYTNESTDQAESDGRMVRNYDAFGDLNKTYYQRGLDVSIDSTNLGYLPKSLNLYLADNYEVKFDKLYSELPSDMFTNWESMEVDEWYPADYCFYLIYSESQTELNIDFKFKMRPEPEADETLDKVKMSIGSVKCTFRFGSVMAEEASKHVAWQGTLYHIPAITFYKGNSLDSMEEVESCDSMALATQFDALEDLEFIYEFENSPADILDGHYYFRITLRLDPTEEEIDDYAGLRDYFILSHNKVQLNCVNLYYDKLEQGIETIKTYERKYHISYGKHGDFPPHGYDSTGSLLYPIPDDKSTVFQYDTLRGVVGMPSSAGENKTMNKCRGRIMKECHEDKEKPPGVNIYDWEAEQKKIHDAIAIQSGYTYFSMKSTIPPGMQRLLDEVGVIFPSWTCSFTNTLVRPLAEVKPYETYSPCGHFFFHNTKYMTHRYDCGRHGFVFGRVEADVFDYSYIHACSDSFEWDQMDVLTAFRMRVGRLLNSFLNPVIAGSYREETQQRLNQFGTTDPEDYLDLPDPVSPMS